GGEECVVRAYRVSLVPDVCRAVLSLYESPDPNVLLDSLDKQDRQLLEESLGKPFSDLVVPIPGMNLYESCKQAFEQGDWINALGLACKLRQEKLYLVHTYKTGQWSNVDAADVNEDDEFEVAIGSGDRSIYFYRLYGELLWSFETGERVRAVHIVDFDRDGIVEILVGSGDRHIYIFEPDGRLKAKFQTKDRVRSLYVEDIDGDGSKEIIAGIGERTLAIFNETGGLKWDFDAQDRIYSVYAADIDQDGVKEVICGSGDRRVYVFSGSGKEIWRRETGDWVNSVCAHDIDADGQVEILVGSGDRCIHCFNGYDGTLRWKYETAERVYAVYVDDIDRDGRYEVIIGSEDKFIYVFDSDGDLKWKYQTNDWIRSIVSADLDRDGQHELIVGSYGPDVSIYRPFDKAVIERIIEKSFENWLGDRDVTWEAIQELWDQDNSYLQAFAVKQLVASRMPDDAKFDIAARLWKRERHPLVRIALLRCFGSLYQVFPAGVVKMIKKATREVLSTDVAHRTRQTSEIEQALLESSLLVSRFSSKDGFSLLQLLLERGSKLTRRNIARASIGLFDLDVERTYAILDSLATDSSEWVKYETARTIADILDREPDRILGIVTRLLHRRAFDVFETIRELSRQKPVKQVFEFYSRLLEADESSLPQTLKEVIPILRERLVAYRLGEDIGLVYDLMASMYEVQTVSEIVTLLPRARRSIGMIGEQQNFRDILAIFDSLVGAARHLDRYEKENVLSDKFTCLIDATTELDKSEEFLGGVPEPEKRVLRALVVHWRAIVLDAVQRLQSRANLEVRLRSRRVHRADRVNVEIEVVNKGKGVAENIILTLSPSTPGEFQIEGSPERSLDDLYSEENTLVVYTLTQLGQQRVNIALDVQFDDLNERGRHVRASEVLTVLDLPGEFRPIVPNPYVFGRPLITGEMFFGRQDILEFIRGNLGGSQNNVIVLQGERRTGKTSILYQIQRHLAPDFIPVLIDVPAITADTGLATFLYSLALKLATELKEHGVAVSRPRREEYFQAAALQFREEFLPAVLRELGDRTMVLMLDEIAGVHQAVEEGRLDKSVLPFLRSIMQHSPQLAFILTGAREIKSLTASYTASWFIIGIVKRVGFLQNREARELVTE
ncbi:hypothetical protein DRJ16_04240, partial [Candidatus Woesearchaeota archaeon]